jgi:hypothetical protein
MVVAELEKTLSSCPAVDSVVSLLDGVVEKLSVLKRKVGIASSTLFPVKDAPWLGGLEAERQAACRTQAYYCWTARLSCPDSSWWGSQGLWQIEF